MNKVFIASYNDKKDKLEDVLNKNTYSKHVVIRLGGVKEYPGYEIQINKSKPVMNCIDKLVGKELMEKAGVPVLKTFLEPTNYPFVLKGRVRSKGTSVFLCESEAEYKAYLKLIPNGWYIEPLFKWTSEYRLHCTQDEVFFAVKKVKFDGHEPDPFINAKNHSNRREFLKPRLWKQVQEQSIAAIKSLGLDIGAVDVGYCSETEPHSFVIHEVNTNPELLTNTFNAYVTELDKLIKKSL